METDGAVMVPAGSPAGEPAAPTQVAEGTTPDTTVAPSTGQGAAADAPTAQGEWPSKPYDWYDPTTWGDRKPEDVMKEVQKKINSLSEESKSHKSILEQEREQRQQLLHEAEAVLKDEKLYALYRQRLGLQPTGVEAMPAPKDIIAQLPMVELTPDMSVNEAQERFNRALQERDKFHTEYTKKAVSEAVEHFKKEIYKELGQSLAPMHKSKWKSAMDGAMQTFGPAFMEARNKVVSFIDGPYAGLYNGENETELIEKVFRAECPEQYNKYILSKATQKANTVAQAATAPATRSVATMPSDSSVESCIARANARAEAALRAKGLI